MCTYTHGALKSFFSDLYSLILFLNKNKKINQADVLSSAEYLFILRNSYIETTISKLIKAIYFLARNQARRTWRKREKKIWGQKFLLGYLYKKLHCCNLYEFSKFKSLFYIFLMQFFFQLSRKLHIFGIKILLNLLFKKLI